ncbi:hypothetical protein NX02_12845 [Sphingomonas sanxanigenens DSM 19645 = NX02]|uniref:Uncharacterized protein n=1 Tax=Sphingomonas sanxanigenens DSM 19645 = NX02 TaxID=1123269 RepID=W0ACJ5_9SPHN|nr:hypothetical protein NX02_12845 [Sphingomonas sanxanigenens DSM 19645 = NX02]
MAMNEHPAAVAIRHAGAEGQADLTGISWNR